VLWYYLIDVGTIYTTSLELVVYTLIFMGQTLVLASTKIMDKFIAEVVDAQISFTTTVTLSKNQPFCDRVHKAIAF
jgi:histone acetyltransferase (RNA polymerase elongator complex component)